MSTKLTGYVWDGCAASGMKLSSVAIMARLADFSNDEGVCWPSIETIARQIGAGMSTVRTAIARLEAEGWLTRKARRQGNRNASNVYQLNVAKLQAAAFSQLSDSDQSKSDASKSDPSKFDASKSGKKAGFHPSESGGDPSVKSKHDPSDKKPSRPDASQPDTQTAEQDFLTRHPDAVVFSPKKRQWGTQDDLTCAQWLWKKIIALYEQAAECDGEVVRPKEPNWTAWANEIRLMCVQDGRTHKQICEMYSRVKGAFAGKSLISEAGRKFQSAACAAIIEQLRRLPKPTSAPASVEIVLFPPDSIDTSTPMGRFFFHVMGALAEMERELIVERTKAGLEAARAQGRIGGRRPKLTPEQWAQAGRLIASGVPRQKVAIIYDVGISTLYKKFPVGDK